MKIKKKIILVGGRSGWGETCWLGGVRGRGLCLGGSGWGVRVDVNEELKFL